MSIENLLQNFANATGIITDRTFSTPRVLGQAFLVSKSRMVACAGCIFNYVDSPWALSVTFPHPGVTLGVKTIALHPEFDRKEARSLYLNQTASSKFLYPVQFNDLATLVIQSELRDTDPELVGQLHRALSIPFSSEGVKASGSIQGGGFQEAVKNILSTGQSGLLTIFDEINIPIAYLQITGGNIERVYYQGIAGEMAFAELVYRQVGNGYAFKPNESFAWGDLRKIEMPSANLIAEAVKRAQELPGMLSSLGGPQARYQRVVKEFNSQPFNPSVQWLINNIWQAIDGYLTVDQLSERVGADTYTLAQGLRELSNQGVVSLINRQTPFHMSGNLGTPIVSHTDFDINPGDTLKSFYLDPISGAPSWQDGDFAGVASVLQPKNLLHSIPLRLKVPGALILKNYKLIGVHSGAVPAKSGQSAMERQLYQMMWIGALFDMGTKKLRASAESEEGTDPEAATISGTKLPSLRERRQEDESAPVSEKPVTYVCSNCFATNAKLGNCFNCGAVVVAPPVQPKKEGFFNTTLRIKAISHLQEKYKLTDKQMFLTLGAAAVVLLFLISMIIAGNSVSNTAPPMPASTPDNKNAAQAVQLAVNVVGFKGIAPPGYWFADTSAATNPVSSFALLSESSNQKVLFVVFNDMSPIQALDRFVPIPPFSDVIATPQGSEEKYRTTSGAQIIGNDKFHYYLRPYPTASGTDKIMLVGSFPAKEAGKGVLVLGQALNAGVYDYKSTLFLIDTMAESLTSAANKKLLSPTANPQNNAATPTKQPTSTPGSETGNKTTEKNERPAASDNKFATPDEISKYCQDLAAKMQKKIDADEDLMEQVKKMKFSKLKVVFEVDLAADGNFTKLEIIEPDLRQRTNDDLVKAINACSPCQNVPNAEGGVLNLRVVFKNGTIKIESRE